MARGPLRDRIVLLAQELGIEDRIIWRDRVDDPRDVYEALDVFAVSSIYEGMPYTILEAMSMERPVVATSISGCRELVRPGVTGFLAEPNDPSGLARHLLHLLQDQSLARQMGAEARRTAACRCPLTRFLIRISQVYDDLAS